MEIVVIGAGIGGMSCAAVLAHNGFDVKILEQNSSYGGKAGQITKNGYIFDKGPSLLTIPNWIDDLFFSCGKNPKDYFNYFKLNHVTRYFFEDDKFTDVMADLNETAENFELSLNLKKEVFLNYFKLWTEIYDISEKTFLEGDIKFNYNFLKSAFIWFKHTGLSSIVHSMAKYNSSKLDNQNVEKIMNRFATYTGSSPYKTPAFMNQLAVVEMIKGAYFPNGGIFSVSTALYNLCLDLGVKFTFNEKIVALEENNKGIKVRSKKTEYNAEKLVSNIDYYVTQKLLGRKIKIQTTGLSTSAIVFYWGIKGEFAKLKLHNIFFSNNYKKEFAEIFNDAKIPSDPTIYINISSKLENSHAPKGCENWFVMINIPTRPNLVSENEIIKVRNFIISKLSNKLKVELKNLIDFEEVLTPETLYENTGAYKGALYGENQNSLRQIMKRKSNFDKKSKNLFYVGGSVHPGGGIPLALKSGINTAKKIIN